jgi:subtilisin family serine protease
MTDRISFPQLSSQSFKEGEAFKVEEIGALFAEKLRARGFTGKGITIAILDSGRGRADRCGHGSAMVEAIKSVAPGATINMVRILDDKGDGDMDQLQEALEGLEGKGFDIINLSLGRDLDCGGICPSCHSIERLAAEGVHVFAAVGNNADTNNVPNCPAVSLGAMSVGGERIDGDPTAFTVKGWSLNGRLHPMIQAPGGDGILQIIEEEWIIVSVPIGSQMDKEFPQLPPGKAATRGSSIATGFVSGLSALLVESGQHPRDFFGLPAATSHPSPISVLMGRASITIRSMFEQKEMVPLTMSSLTSEVGKIVGEAGEELGKKVHDQLEILW